MSTVNIGNPTASLPAKQFVTTADAADIIGLLTFSNNPAAPFVVQPGSANVKNLDANFLQGQTVAGIVAQFVVAPSGTVLMHGSSSIPSGWFLCNGQTISRTTYATLFALIGVTYGIGDGSTTFNVPDLRQRFPLGVSPSGTGSTLGGVGGAVDHTHTYTQVINHTHSVTITDPGHDHTTHKIYNDSNTINPTGSGFNYVLPSNFVSPGANTTGITMASVAPGGGVGSGTTAAQNPPYVAVNFIIKT